MQADQENLAVLRQQIQESIDRVRRSIEITRRVFMRDDLLAPEERLPDGSGDGEEHRRSA